MGKPDETAVGDARETTALARVEEHLLRASLEPLCHARFLESHDCFEAASTQRAQIADWFANRAYRRPPLDVLSIGSGGGNLDQLIVRSLREAHGTARYTGVDPNPVECDRCRALMRALAPGFDARVVEASFEDAVLPAADHDLVFAVHTLYYLGNVDRALARAMSLLRPGGELVVFQAPRGKLNRLSSVSWERHLQRSVEFSEDLAERLGPMGGQVSRIEAWVDVTSCLEGGPEVHAVALRDFILQVDSQQLDAACIAAVDAYLVAIGRRDDQGRWWVPHPVDAHVVRRPA